MRSATVGLIGVALAAAATMAGCSSTAQGAADVPGPTAEQKAQWALPLDPYIQGPVSLATTEYAENTLVKDCMGEHGKSWPIPHVDVSSLQVRTTSPSGRKIQTPEIAAKYGYHQALMVPAATNKKMLELNSKPLDAATQSTLDACIQTARKTLPRPDYSQIAVQLANDALKSAGKDKSVVAAADRWRECMQPEGIPDLPDAPDGLTGDHMPTSAQAEQFNLQDPVAKPSTAEVRVAVADAKCRASSGYNDALYTAEWDQQAKALTKNADQLKRDGDALDAYLANAKSVLAQHPGA